VARYRLTKTATLTMLAAPSAVRSATAAVTARTEGGSGSCASTPSALRPSKVCRRLFVRITSCSSATRRTCKEGGRGGDTTVGRRGHTT